MSGDSVGATGFADFDTFETLLPCPKKRLILFDIDGTLLRCGTQVGAMFLEAMDSVYGSRGDWRGFSFAGKTDGQIVLELLERTGHDREMVFSKLPQLQAHYLPRVESELDPKKMELLPGVITLLDRLEADDAMHLGLVTGNWERGGRAKLEAFDLNRYFGFGAFAEDGVARNALPPAAVKRAEAMSGESFAAEEVLIVGDTPNDVACAHAHGYQCLAVATGNVPAGLLAEAGADWVVATLAHLGSGALEAGR